MFPWQNKPFKKERTKMTLSKLRKISGTYMVQHTKEDSTYLALAEDAKRAQWQAVDDHKFGSPTKKKRKTNTAVASGAEDGGGGSKEDDQAKRKGDTAARKVKDTAMVPQKTARTTRATTAALEKAKNGGVKKPQGRVGAKGETAAKKGVARACVKPKPQGETTDRVSEWLGGLDELPDSGDEED